MGTFKIDVDEFSWITGTEDDPNDLCLHGRVTVQIGEIVKQDYGTVSATALYLLKSLKEDKVMAQYDIQMVPCCGHFWIANSDLTSVSISGCDTGMDWSILHENGGVTLVLPTGETEWVELQQYRAEVIRFVHKIEKYYEQCQPKIVPENEFERNGYIAFWNEWNRRYTDALLLDALATGREVELQYDGLDYFIGRDDPVYKWYLYCEQTKEKQVFHTAEELYANATFGSKLFQNETERVTIKSIL